MVFAKRKKTEQTAAPPCTAVIAAAGASARMDGEDKLFIEICGAPVLAHALMAYQNCALVNEIIIVVREDNLETAAGVCKAHGIEKAGKVIVGGETRFASVYNGVFAVSRDAGLIAIHDGARPCVDGRIIEQAIKAAAEHHAAVPAIPVSSTVKRAVRGVVTETVSRDDLYEIQTPQVFDADLIKAALTSAMKNQSGITDDCMSVEMLGVPVHITEGSRSNIKLTTREDIIIAESVLKMLLRGRSTS